MLPRYIAIKTLSESHSDIRSQKDRQYTYLAERMELSRQKRNHNIQFTLTI